MKFDHYSLKRILLIDLIVILSVVIIIPLLLDLFGLNIKILVISFIGNILIISTIIITVVDLFYLLRFRRNIYLLSSLSMSFTISLFLLLEYCFLNDYHDFIYVWSYSKSTLPIVYKIVAIWAGEAGSIMTWMLFNSIIIFFYRLKNQNKDDIIFIVSVIISSLISLIFLIILFSFNPFQIQTPIPPPTDGRGLNPLLISPFMIWHPLFTFIAYAIFLIPFTISIIEIIKPNKSLENSYQKSFYDFSLKFGWLVLTVGIGLGAYWAKIALNWGRYWGWDPVETVSLVPWFFSTAYFHTITFKKKNSRLVKINIISIFLSIIFSTLITRGGYPSLHAFTDENNLIIWILIVGSILIIFSLYVIYNSLNSLSEEYKKTRLFLDYLSYLFLFMLAFVCIFGLFMTPLSIFLSYSFSFNIIGVGPDFFILTTLVLATGLAVTLIFCSLYDTYKLKWITVGILIGAGFQSVLSLVLFLFSSIWINPLISIFVLALLTSIFKLLKDFDSSKGIKHFFRINSKTYVHTGLSLILIGTLIDPEAWFFQDIFFISGFIFLVSGIIPSILILFFLKRSEQKGKLIK